MELNIQTNDTQTNQPSLENYSFCLFRIPKEGGRVLWEITNSCNYSCSYCIFSANKGKVNGELSTEEVFEVIDGLKQRDFSHLKISGGEPFIRKDMVDILKKASDLGFIVDISTNGSLITEKRAQQLSELELNMVHVSLDGPDAKTHEEVRGPKTYEKTIRGIQNLVTNNVYVRLGTVIHKGNEHQLEEVVKKAASLGVNEVIFSYMEPVGRMEGDNSQVSYKPIETTKSEIEILAQKYQDQVKVNYSFTEDSQSEETGTCPGGKKFLFIDNLGRISPCTWVTEKDPTYQTSLTVKDASFDEVMTSNPMQNYVESCKDCKGCPARIRYE
ncbi:radical SAM protein [Candidatus Woesearchaeota archaeon]|jgi:MoaA/NifB/PqqE/SkfB family radical SAM enzyme|nr:radical SAM protein [Candidatus Woesearchaeota archaeon]